MGEGDGGELRMRSGWGIKNGFLLEKRRETNKRNPENQARVKQLGNERRAENRRSGYEFALQRGEKRGWRADWRRFSAYFANEDEPAKTAILIAG